MNNAVVKVKDSPDTIGVVRCVIIFSLVEVRLFVGTL